MKNITHYFSDLSSNSKMKSPAINEITLKQTTSSTAFGVHKKLRMKRKHEPENDLFNKNEQVKQKQIKKVIESGNNKRKIIEEIIKIENNLEKKKKKNSVQSNKNLEISQDEKNIISKKFNNSKYSDNLLTYFSKTNSKGSSGEKFIEANITIKAEINNLKNPLHSICTTFDKKEEELSSVEDLANSKSLQREINEIRLLESESLVVSPKNNKLIPDIQQTKRKWSLKIQLQSNINKSGIIDDSDFYTSNKSNCQNKNLQNCIKIHKVLLPIKNNKQDFSLDNCISKSKKEEKIKLNKIDSEENFSSEKINDLENKKWNSSSFVKQLYKFDNLYSKKQNLQTVCHTSNKNFCKNELKEKFAPLFTTKIETCPEIIVLDNLALKSVVYINDEYNKVQKIVSAESTKLPFPKVSHITQLPLESHTPDQIYNFLFKKNENFLQKFDLLQIKHVLKLDSVIYIPEITYECVKSDIKAALFEIKSYCSDAEDLWKFVSKFTKYKNCQSNTKISSCSSDKNISKCFNSNDFQNKLSYSLWTDKYKPNCSNDIVGNEEAVSKLKFWLNTWKSLKSDEDSSSSEEFYTSNWSTNSLENQVAVLIGPHGSGKTTSVYAIANELGYKVLEVNASSKRPGKQILKDFKEATKSHRVEQLNLNNISKFKSKKVKSEEISQNSLILLEDIDLIFEEDDGFISAIFHLASNSKRPIVMTLSNPCSHLYKMAPNQLQINFQPVTGNRLSALLQLIILSETGCKLSHNCLNLICESGDLRKCLLQLQYLLLSGKEHISFTSLAINNSFYQNMQICMYKSLIKIKNSKKNHVTNNERINNILDNLANSSDNFTLISQLFNINNPSTYLKFEPSISLIENSKQFSSLDNINLEIGNCLDNTVNILFKNWFKITSGQLEKSCNQLFIKKKMYNNIDKTLSQIASITLDRRALAVDYISNIRTICRAEKIRNQFNNKRGNRFFHYLQNFRLVIGTVKSNNIFSAACKILQKSSTPVGNINE